MDTPQSNFDFKLMSINFKIRDFFTPPKKILQHIGIKPGFFVLDYGCGPGSYIAPLAELVGESGRIYAMDINPLALKAVQRIALKNNIKNIETLKTDCQTGLPEKSIDVVLLNDIFHGLSQPEKVLQELFRILKDDGILSFNDHHLQENDILNGITQNGFFRFEKKYNNNYRFIKAG